MRELMRRFLKHPQGKSVGLVLELDWRSIVKFIIKGWKRHYKDQNAVLEPKEFYRYVRPMRNQRKFGISMEFKEIF